MNAEPDEGHAEVVADCDQLLDVVQQLLARAMQRLARRARQLDLRTRLEGDRNVSALQGDRAAGLELLLPPEPFGESLKDGFDARRAREPNGRTGGG